MTRSPKKTGGRDRRGIKFPGHGVVRTCLEIVPIAYIKRSRVRAVRFAFSPAEAATLSQASPQTVAGLIAAKKAAAAIVVSLCGGRVTLRDINLAHAAGGAPRLGGLPRGARVAVAVWRDIRVSISHTATHAFGCAAVFAEEVPHA
jgi:phosphopantetheinyl transferase (holo-ACP synthase)